MSEKEKNIEEEIYLAVRDKAYTLKSKEVRALVKEEIKSRNYLSEDWQVHYAVERVKSMVETHLKENPKQMVNKNKKNKPLIQTLRKRFNNSKLFDHFGIISAILGIVGLFFAGIILGFLAIIIGKMARFEKQKLATFGIVLGIIDIVLVIAVIIFNITSNGALSSEDISKIIVNTIVGGAFALIISFEKK